MRDKEVRTQPPPGDEPDKMVRAEKEGATVGPIHGSLEGGKELILNGVIGAMSAFLKR